MNGVISLPLAVLAYFFLPDTPGTAKPNWIFSERVSCVTQEGPHLPLSNTPHLGHRDRQGENGKSWARSRRKIIHSKDICWLRYQLENTSLHPHLHDSTIRITAFYSIRFLA